MQSEAVAAPRGGGDCGGPKPRSRQKLSKKNSIKLVGYPFRLKNYVKIPPPTSFGFCRAGAATGVKKVANSLYFQANEANESRSVITSRGTTSALLDKLATNKQPKISFRCQAEMNEKQASFWRIPPFTMIPSSELRDFAVVTNQQISSNWCLLKPKFKRTKI